MKIKEASIRFQVSCGTVRKYCQQGFIVGAQKIHRQWIIPDDAICPLYFSTKKVTTQTGRLHVILKAVDQQKTIPLNKLAQTKRQARAFLTLVERAGYVKRLPGCLHDDWFQTVCLSEQGIQLLASKRRFNITSEVSLLFSGIPPVIIPSVKVQVKK